jgi:hypothetical protein
MPPPSVLTRWGVGGVPSFAKMSNLYLFGAFCPVSVAELPMVAGFPLTYSKTGSMDDLLNPQGGGTPSRSEPGKGITPPPQKNVAGGVTPPAHRIQEAKRGKSEKF